MPDFDKCPDNELVELLRSGSHQAYSEIYQRYWVVLYRHARKMLQNEEEARDLVQDLFVTLWCKRQEIIFDSTLSSYLYAATRNRILNLFKRNRIKEDHLSSLKDFIECGINVTDHLVRARNLEAIIEQEIALLPDRMREVFELKRKGYLSYKEIAVEMHISDHTVKTQMNRALKILRVRLGEIIALLPIFF